MRKILSRLSGAAALTALMSSPVSSQDVKARLVTSPELGVEQTVPTGGELYSYSRLYTIEGARIDADTKAGDWLVEQRVPAGTLLVPVSTSKPFKGCVPSEGTFEANGPCFIDDDGDGTLDRHSRDEVVIFRKLKPPVPYTKTDISLMREDSFRYVLLYSGATGDTLRFSYREFKDNLARPAFTEELTIPREELPQMIALKGRVFEISAVGGMGLSYRLIK